MNRFRLFRSKAFWFGVPGLVGLLWGWWVSMGYWSHAGFRGQHSQWIGQVGGEVYAIWDLKGWPDWQQFAVWHNEKSVEEVSAVKRFVASEAQKKTATHIVFVPYYLPVVSYVAVWAGLLIWRKRRYDKLPVE